MRHTLYCVFLLLTSCSPKQVEGPPPVSPREASPVNAPEARTWDAVIEVFADRSIPIRTMERASGLIVTEQLSVNPKVANKWADCGESRWERGRIAPNQATYNVLVRGDSTASTVKVTVRWVSAESAGLFRDCSTRGTWEQDLEREISGRAQGGRG